MIKHSIARLVPVTAILCLLLTACGTTKVVQNWEAPTQPSEPQKLAVVVMAAEALQRAAAEKAVVEKLRAAGVNAVVSSDIRGMRGRLTREKAVAALTQADVDTVLVSFLVGAQRGEELQRADYYLQYEGTGIYYDWFSPGFTNVYTVQEGPGYSESSIDVYVETNYIDVSSGNPAWNMVTATKDPQYRDVAGAISDKIISQMRKTGQL